MSCEEILPLIHGHLDGINTEAEEQQLQAHLQTCPACRSLLSMYEQIDAQVQQLEVEAPEQLAAGVMYKIGLEKNGRKRRFGFGRGTAWAAAAAAVVLVIGSGYLGFFGETADNMAMDQRSVTAPNATEFAVTQHDESASDTTTKETSEDATTQPVGDGTGSDTAAAPDGISTLTAGPAVTVYGDGEAWETELLELLQPYAIELDSGRYAVPRSVAEEVAAEYGDRYEIQSSELKDEDNLLVLIPS